MFSLPDELRKELYSIIGNKLHKQGDVSYDKGSANFTKQAHAILDQMSQSCMINLKYLEVNPMLMSNTHNIREPRNFCFEPILRSGNKKS
jgi:hypothetical protein